MRLILLALIALFTLSVPLTAQTDDGYTVAEVIAAYEAGQFRVIHTRSVWLHASLDGSYVAASFDGVYRTSDGAYFPQYDRAIFSPDSLYVAQENDGVYRLSDGHKMFDIGALPRFTDDSTYLAAEGYGVYRLSDGQKLFDIDDSDSCGDDGCIYSFYTYFSPNGNYVAIDQDGVYRLSDGQKLFDIEGEAGYVVSFSHDEKYAASTDDGVYRLRDRQKLLDLDSFARFSPNGNYVFAYGDGIYRLADNEKLFAIREGSATFSPDEIYVAIDGDGIYHIDSGERLFDSSATTFRFSPDSLLVASSDDGVYRLSDEQKLFDISGHSPRFSEGGALLITVDRNNDLDNMYRVSDGSRLSDVPYGVTTSPDGQYAAVGTVGFYRLSDEQQLFKIEEVNTKFSRDGEYIIASSADSASVYRVSDGHRFTGLQLLNTAAGIMAVGNTILVVDPTQDNQHLSFVRNTDHGLYSTPNNEAEVIRHINGGEYLAILDEQNGWYQVSYSGKIGWIPADDLTVLNVPG